MPPTPAALPDLDRIRATARAIEAGIVRTPCLHSHTLSDITGAEIWVKFENLQFTASFKDRGSLARLLEFDADQRRAGVVAMSAGNHAQGVAYHAGRLGVPATIVMPTTTPAVKVAQTRRLGAKVVQVGRDLSACRDETERLAAGGLTLVHPYDDPAVIAGQGTCGLEILADVEAPDQIVVPVGGGGLASGIGIVCEAMAPDVELIGVQVDRYDAMTRAVTGRGPAGTDTWTGPSLADGIAVKAPGELTVAALRRTATDMVTVAESTIERAVVLFAEIEKSVSEGAGAAGLAAVLDDPERFRGKRVVVVLTGGNIDTRLLASVLVRGLAREGRLTHLRIEADDLPGSLARIAAVISAEGADVVEVSHQRLLIEVPARRVDIDVLIETRGADHSRQVMDALAAEGFGVSVRSE